MFTCVVSNSNFQRTDSGEWNRGQRSTESFVPPTNAMETYQQQQQSIDYGQFDYEKRRDSRPSSRAGIIVIRFTRIEPNSKIYNLNYI